MARATGPTFSVYAKVNFHHMREFMDTVSYYGQRKTMHALGKSLQHEITRYVPVGKTHNLQKSYVITTGRDKMRGPWFNLAYQNTEKAPYTMYQYYGEVYGTNYPVWRAGIKLKKNPADTQVNWEHVGWVSKKGEKKYNTHRPLGIRRTIKTKDGRYIYIKGYSKKKPRPHARWVEWYCNQPKFNTWKDITGQKIVNDILNQYRKRLGNG